MDKQVSGDEFSSNGGRNGDCYNLPKEFPYDDYEVKSFCPTMMPKNLQTPYKGKEKMKEGMKQKHVLMKITHGHGTGVYLPPPPFPSLKRNPRPPPLPTPPPSRPSTSSSFNPWVPSKVVPPKGMNGSASKSKIHKKIKMEWRIRSKPAAKEDE